MHERGGKEGHLEEEEGHSEHFSHSRTIRTIRILNLILGLSGHSETIGL